MKKWLWVVLAAIAVIGVGLGIVLAQAKPPILKSQVVTLKVKPRPDFTLAVTPLAIESAVGNTVAYGATVTSIKGFAGQVIFSMDGLPAGFTVEYLPGNVVTLGTDAPRGVQINISIPNDEALVGDYTITINAESTNYN